MNIRLASLAVVSGVIISACADQPQAGGTATATRPTAATASQPSRTYRTGSRLPALEDDAGASTVGGVSQDDYQHDRNSAASPVKGM